MELSDGPPGAEGYQDTVVEVPKKLEKSEDTGSTKAEQEFLDHLNSLKIKVEDGTTRCMVERRGRDISGKYIYLCYPCAAMCSGENILQTHISGKKHKSKLAMRSIWPHNIFDDHPYIQSEKGTKGTEASEKTLQKMAEEVDLYNKNSSELEQKYNKYRNVACHIQDTLDVVKAPLLGLEYLIEHPPEEVHHEPSYICSLCSKQGHPRTIINHMTCFWHRHNFLVRHFPKASALLNPYRSQSKFREGVSLIMNRLAQRIEDKFGRLNPVNIDKEEYEKDKESIHRWIFKGPHAAEIPGYTFEEVVDIDLINTLHKNNVDSKSANFRQALRKDPSPPIVAAPEKPRFNQFIRSAGRQERRGTSLDSLSDISDEGTSGRREAVQRHIRERSDRPLYRSRYESHKPRYEPYADPRRDEGFRSRYAIRNAPDKTKPVEEKQRAPNYEYKLKLAQEQRNSAEESAKKTLAYHEKNPEKHPLYPEEWKKFWNRRYKEIQTEGKDPSKHDFKPEWIVYWTKRMKELHNEELRVVVNELYRKLRLTPPDMSLEEKKSPERRRSGSRRRTPDSRRRSPDSRRKSPENKRRSPDLRRKSPDPRRKSPDPRRKSPDPRRKSPDPRRISPGSRRISPDRRRSPIPRRRTPNLKRRSPDMRRRSPDPRSRPHYKRSTSRDRNRSPERRRSPVPQTRRRSRSPIVRNRSPIRTNFTLDSTRRSQSPLSRRDALPRNRSPVHTDPSLQTVQISDDELKPDDGLSPWNSDNDIESLGSLPDAKSPPVRARSRSHADSVSSRGSRPRPHYGHKHEYAPPHVYRVARPHPPSGPEIQDLGPPENIVATLRLLVALEDYLGSIGPKIVDLLTEALTMEKERANSSEELLVRESAVVTIETAKERLKGAAQAGLVAGSAAIAVRTAVVRAAATLHVADKRQKDKTREPAKSGAEGVPVAGVGEVDRAQIAQQMAAALVAQGKTDVSSEELAQLVDAVVGMAEAKKREEEKAKQKTEAPAPAPVVATSIPSPKPAAAKVTGTASALQMLQSAYDENEKQEKADMKHSKEKSNVMPSNEEAPDAMDGLSDSDLETLLKNFNELSAEEQHSLIAYLKKLEARDPQRVEKLRQYVGAAAAGNDDVGPAEPAGNAVTIESDDDDYTVEDVFKSATQKVKEDQIRQEMEIVKKSLEETKAPVVPDITRLVSASAADLFALVQASLQSTNATNTISKSADVVLSSTQPRSYGDYSEPLQTINPSIGHEPFNTVQDVQTGNRMDEAHGTWERSHNMPDDRGQMINRSEIRGPPQDISDNRGPSLNVSDNRNPPHLISDNRGLPLHMSDNNRGPPHNMPDNRGPPPNMSDSRGPPHNMPDNRGPPHNMSDSRGPPYNMPDNRGPLHNMLDNRGPPHNMADNRGSPHNMADNRGPPHNMPENRGPPHNMPDNRGPPHNMPDNRGPPHNMPDNRGPPHNMPDNRGLPHNMPDNIGQSHVLGNRGPPYNSSDVRSNMSDMRDTYHISDNRGMQHDARDQTYNMPDGRGPPQSDNRNNMPGNRASQFIITEKRGLLQIPDNRGPYMPDRGRPMPDNRGPQFMPDNQGPHNRGPSNNMYENRGAPINVDNGVPYNMPGSGELQNMPDNRGQPFNMPTNAGPPRNMHDNRPPSFNDLGHIPMQGYNDYDQRGPMDGGNDFSNGRMQDNRQQFGNYGRGRGDRGRGGHMRGRGRGFR